MDEFFTTSWTFFYKFALCLLRRNQKGILRSTELAEMISTIKSDPTEEGDYINWGMRMLRFVPVLREMVSIPTDWNAVVRDSRKEKLNEGYVNLLLNSYDLEHMRFQLK